MKNFGVQYINLFSCRTYTRKFLWDFYPSGFFARLLVRLMHLQIAVSGSWANAAILCSRLGDEAALLQMKKEDDMYYLEVRSCSRWSCYC